MARLQTDRRGDARLTVEENVAGGHSRGRLLPVLAAISMLPAAFLLAGYFAVARPTLTEVQTSPPPGRVRSTTVGVDRGRICIWLATQAPPPAGAAAGRTVRWSIHPGLPDGRRCFFEFDNHSLNAVLTKRGATLYLIAFPIWCLLVPCLIAPLLWLSRRRPPPIQRGFPVNSLRTNPVA